MKRGKIMSTIVSKVDSTLHPSPPKGLGKEEIFYWKLINDKKFYIENFLLIRNKQSMLVPFILNDAQNVVYQKILECERDGKLKRFIVLKARQMGLSTLFEGLIFHDTSNNMFKNSLIVAHEEPASQNLFNMSKLYYENLPEVIRPMKKYSNGKTLAFENPENNEDKKSDNPGLRSKITIATAGAGEVGRSATYHNIHASEVAFFPNAKTTMLGLLQSVPDEMNTLVVLESTANGVGDYFHDMWQKAIRGENEFIPIFLPWFTDGGYTRPFRTPGERKQFEEAINLTTQTPDGRIVRTYEFELMHTNNLTLEQMNWRKHTIQNKCQGDEILFMQEYPATPEESFISTGRPKFPTESLKKYQTITKEPDVGYLQRNKEGVVEFIPDKSGYISIWEYPSPSRSYSVGADVAEGLSHGDFSCAVVGDAKTFNISAMWHGHIDPDLYGMELIKLGEYYNYAYVGVENNNHGLTTLTIMKREEYWNIYFSKQFDRVSDRVTQKIGWSTTPVTKRLMIDKLQEFVREMYIGIYSDLIVSEMFSYVIEDNGSTNAQEGCHDDTVMATAIMLQLLLEDVGADYVPEIPIDERGNIRDNIIDGLFEVDDDTLQEVSN